MPYIKALSIIGEGFLLLAKRHRQERRLDGSDGFERFESLRENWFGFVRVRVGFASQ